MPNFIRRRIFRPVSTQTFVPKNIVDEQIKTLIVGDGTARAFGVIGANLATVWDLKTGTQREYEVGGLIKTTPNEDIKTLFKCYLKDNGTTPTEAVDATPIHLKAVISSKEETLWTGIYLDCKKGGIGVKVENKKTLVAADEILLRVTPTALSAAATKLNEALTEIYLYNAIERSIRT